MLNMLKYQFYRLSRSMSTYITAAILIIFNIMIIGMNASTPGAQAGSTALSNFMTAVDFASFSFISMATPMVYSAWVVIFAYGEFQQGYIRNIASFVKNKCSFFFAHMIVCAVMFIIFTILGSATCIISAKILVANIQIGDFSFLLKFLGAELFLHLGLAALALFAVYLARNIFIPLIVTFAVTMGGIEMVPLVTVQNLITKIMDDSGKGIVDALNHLSIVNNIIEVELVIYNGDPLGIYFIFGGIILLIYSVLACLSITKKDIK